MAKQKEKKQNGKKAPSFRRMSYLAVGAVLVALILYYVMQKTVWNPNRTAEKAARVAFDAAYSVSYEDFVKSTIYSDDCQKYLRMEVFDELQQIETEFKNMEPEKDAFTMQIDNITVKEYAKGSDYYNSAVGMLCDEHAETVPDKIEKVATAEISYRLKYQGDTTHEKGTELYVVFRVKGRWYAHPLLGLTQ